MMCVRRLSIMSSFAIVIRKVQYLHVYGAQLSLAVLCFEQADKAGCT